MHGKIFHAPLNSPSRLVDIGCGTGIQACHLGTAFPEAQTYGIDLSAVPDRDKPNNVEWIQGNIRELVKEDSRLSADSVDYAFSRLLIHGMTDWQGYLNDVAKILKPGGWAEMQEYDQDWYLNGQFCNERWPWLQACAEYTEANGHDWHCGSNIKKYMEIAGLVNVQQKVYRMPYGTWMAKDRPETERIGKHSAREYGTLYHHAIPKMLAGSNYSDGEIEDFQAQSKETMAAEDGKDMCFWVTIGMKPET